MIVCIAYTYTALYSVSHVHNRHFSNLIAILRLRVEPVGSRTDGNRATVFVEFQSYALIFMITSLPIFILSQFALYYERSAWPLI